MRDDFTWDAPRRGFTFIELMIVLAIVVSIVAVLFPVFAGVRERGRRTVCQSNLKEIAEAMHQYVQDNDGFYPSSTKEWGSTPYSYLRNADLFCCPDHHKCIPDLFSVDANTAATYPVYYSYNAPRLYVFSPKNVRGTQDAALANPSAIWLNMDECWVNVDGSLTDPNGELYARRVSSTSCGRGFVGNTIHSGSGNYSYADGHVEWLTPEAAGEIDCTNGPLPAPFDK